MDTTLTDREWFQLFDSTRHKFEWFFDEYGFGLHWDKMMACRLREDREGALSVMNVVWFELPDNKFNIIENPKGWSEFLDLLEA